MTYTNRVQSSALAIIDIMSCHTVMYVNVLSVQIKFVSLLYD